MFRAIAVTALAALAAAQSNEVQSSDGSINIETRNGEMSAPCPEPTLEGRGLERGLNRDAQNHHAHS